jgi:hypothetical protein
VLEQLYSPLIVHTTPEHDELKEIARNCITRHHAHHYLGFADTQWRLFSKEQPRRIKPLLYTYRVLLTGIHLMQTGVVEANLAHLNQEYGLSYIDDLIRWKTTGTEHGALPEADIQFHEQEYTRLHGALQTAHEHSTLPHTPSAHATLHDLLVRLCLKGLG